MKKIWLSSILTIVSSFSFGANRYWIATSTGNWNSITNWSTASGGAAGASVPGSGDVAIFNAAKAGNCILDISPTVGGITTTGYIGIIDLAGFDFNTTGTNTFGGGTFSNSGTSASVILNTVGTTTFSGTLFSVPVSGSSGRINFNGSTFNNTVNLTKSAVGTDLGNGGNTFNAAVTFTLTSTGSLQFAGTSSDVFQSTLTLNVNSTGSISLARVAAGTQFNGNVSINYNSTGSVSFGAGNGTSSLATTKTITVASYGASGCGNLSLSYLTQLGSTSQDIELAGNNSALLTVGPNTVFNAPVTLVTPDLDLNRTTFQSTTQITKTGNTESDLHGGSTFFGTTTVTNNGADLVFGHYSTEPGDTFNGNITFNNIGGNRIRIPEQNTGTVFNGTTVFNGSATTDVNNRIQISRLAGSDCTFNGPVYINNTGNGSDIHISYDAGSSATFKGPVFITSNTTATSEFFIGVDGNVAFTNNIEFNSTCTDDIYLSDGNGAVTFGNGVLSIGASGFSLGSIRFSNFTQTGTTAQSLTLTGTALLRFGTSTFKGNVNFVAPQVYFSGATFNGATYIEKSGATDNTSTGGDFFNGVTTLVNSGSGSFELAGTNPDVFATTLTVTNSGPNRIQIGLSSAGNIFNGNVTFNHTGTVTTTNNFIVARNAGCTAQFNGTLTLNCASSNVNSGIIIGYDGAVTLNGNVTVSTTSGRGVLFGNNNGSVTLNSGNSILPGTFTTGTLQLKSFTQLGSTPQTLNLTGTASLNLGPSSTFNGNVNFTSPQVYLLGTTFYGTTYLEKSGATDNTGTGSNTFNGVTTIVDSGSGAFISGNTSLDTFNNDLTVTNTGAGYISMADASPGNLFNGNIVANCTAGSGVYFGNNTNASATLATGKTITIGATGFTTGQLRLKRFTQAGSTPQTLTLTGTAILRPGPSTTFNGAVTFTSPRVLLDGTTFNSTANIQKNGATTDTSLGGNVFNTTSTLTASGAGIFRLATASGDTFVGDATFVRSSTGTLDVGYVQTTTFTGNIIINSTSGVNFGNGGGTIQFIGGSNQSISKTTGSASPTIFNLSMSKSAGTLTLNTNININTSATFTSGIVNATSANYINFIDNATTSAANDLSYVDGPVRKTGNDAFVFPVGTSGYYRLIGISAPAATTDVFTAQYFKTGQTFGGPSTWDPSFYSVSGCEYWQLDRTTGTSNVLVTLSWNINECNPGDITNIADLRVTHFKASPAAWINDGNGGTTGNTSGGTIISASALTAYGPVTLASVSSANPLPIEMGAFWANSLDHSVELNWETYSEVNNEGFTIERSQAGRDFYVLNEVKGAGFSNTKKNYTFLDSEPLHGISYYRLKQHDFDGKTSYSTVIAVQRDGQILEFTLHPNPVKNEIVHFSQTSTVTVYNSLGQVIASMANVDGFDSSALMSGVYLIRNEAGQYARLVKE